MEIKDTKELKTEALYIKSFEVNEPLGIKSIIRMLSNYEKDNIKMFKCICRTFSESGNSYHPEFSSIEDLEKGVKTFENPSVSFRAIYMDMNTNKYKFDITTAANTNVIDYTVDNEYAEYVNKKIELKLMEEEVKRSEQENVNGKVNQL